MEKKEVSVQRQVDKAIRKYGMHMDYIVFPYGKWGSKVCSYLNEMYGINAKPYDNNKADNITIFDADCIDINGSSNSVAILCTVNEYAKSEFLNTLNRKKYKGQTLEIKLNSTRSRIKQYLYARCIDPKGKDAFLRSLNCDGAIRILDVGCGNNSILAIRNILGEKAYYVGLDVGDCNLDNCNKRLINEYIIVSPESFAEKIEEMEGTYDAIISRHNIEHCNEPERVVEAMAKALKKDGRILMVFPSIYSTEFPSRGGCLNFFDDHTHSWLPDYNGILQRLKLNGVGIEYANRKYQPFILRMIGWKNEKESLRINHTMEGTWAYYGFESVIWGKKLSDE